MIVSFAGCKGRKVAGFAEASALYCAARDKGRGAGASKFRIGTITDDRGKPLATISYNGNVWPPVEWFSGMEPLLKVSGLFA